MPSPQSICVNVTAALPCRQDRATCSGWECLERDDVAAAVLRLVIRG